MNSQTVERISLTEKPSHMKHRLRKSITLAETSSHYCNHNMYNVTVT